MAISKFVRRNDNFKVLMTPLEADKIVETLDKSKIKILAPAHEAAAKAIADSVSSGFDKATTKVMPNMGSTRVWKIKNGYATTPLIMEGRLREGVKNSKASVTVGTGNIIGVVEIPIPTAGSRGERGAARKNKSFPYGMAHLFGAGGNMRKFGFGEKFKLPQRDFLTDGLKEGGRKAANILATSYKAYYDAFLSPAFFNQRVLPIAWEKQLKLTEFDIISVAMPPSKYYSALGFGSDFTSAFAFSFNTFTINNWFGTLAAGHAGLTKRTYIRRGRKTLYGRG